MTVRAARALAASGALGLLLAGCAIPSWVPVVGKPAPPPASRVAAEALPPPRAPAAPRPPVEADDTIADRVVAVVNNDAITLVELQESVLSTRQDGRLPELADDTMARELLGRLIDARLQLQEADREKIAVEDGEVEEELADRLKRLPGTPSRKEFEEAITAQGLSVDLVKKRVRDSLRMAKVVRRKVALRVSVNDQEIDRYLDRNRDKLETGLSYHALNILVVPDEGGSDAAWERARIRAVLLREQIVAGADFADVARQHSQDATARDGGDLGTLKRGELAAEVEAAILRLRPGEVSPPFRSSLGWHLFRLESRESLEGQRLEQARQQIRDILYREKYEARLDAWLKDIKGRAIIDIRL